MNDETRKPTVTVGICDDMPEVLANLKNLAHRCLEAEYTPDFFCCTSPKELLDRSGEFHVVILDIQLERENGITVARRLLQCNPDCRLIFVTGYLNYVSDVYEIPHLCLILKDQLEKQLPQFLPRAAAEALRLNRNVLTVAAHGSLIRLPLDQIRCMERQGHITCISTVRGENIRTREKLDTLVRQIPDSPLFRCHVSYLVNLRHVSALEESGFRMDDKSLIPISRFYSKTAKAAFLCYLQTKV